MERFTTINEADAYVDEHEAEAEFINAVLCTYIHPEDAKMLWWHFFTEAQRLGIARKWQEEQERKAGKSKKEEETA